MKSNILCPVCKKIIDMVIHDDPDGPSPYYSASLARANHLKTTSCDSFEDWMLGYLVEPAIELEPEVACKIIDRYAELNCLQQRDLFKMATSLGLDGLGFKRFGNPRPYLIREIILKEFEQL